MLKCFLGDTVAETINIVRGEHKFNSPFGEERTYTGAAVNQQNLNSQQYQQFVACPHYPNAIHNYFEHPNNFKCEFCK